MNELRVPDPFDADPFLPALREFWRPWRGMAEPRAPQIRVDVAEDDAGYTVKADIPGVRKEDIDVRVDGNQVTIAAEVKQDKEEKKEGRVLRSERLYGWASRSFALASDVDAAAVQAKYADGVLELKLPKKPSRGTKRIEIA